MSNIRTRQEALEAGEARYFTGEPCKHGHVSERWVMSGRCIACQEESREEERARYMAAKEARAGG